MDLEIGTILIAKTICKMKDGTGNALVIGKEYPIKKINECDEIVIESETDVDHYFDIDEDEPHYYGKYFDIKV
jgi:hypothetical protein